MGGSDLEKEYGHARDIPDAFSVVPAGTVVPADAKDVLERERTRLGVAILADLLRLVARMRRTNMVEVEVKEVSRLSHVTDAPLRISVTMADSQNGSSTSAFPAAPGAYGNMTDTQLRQAINHITTAAQATYASPAPRPADPKGLLHLVIFQVLQLNTSYHQPI